MGSTAAFTLLLILLVGVPAIFAVTFQVGDVDGWNSAVDYTTWVKGKTFRVGDTLEFKYGSFHSVAVVDKAGFDNCDDSGATQSFSGGDTKINLTKVGTIHFLCSTPGHCLSGMKLAVPVLAAVSTPASPLPPSPSLAPRSPRKPKTPKAPSPSPSVSRPASRTSTLSKTPTHPLTPSSSPSAHSPSPSKHNAASKEVLSYGMKGLMIVLMYGLMS